MGDIEPVPSLSALCAATTGPGDALEKGQIAGRLRRQYPIFVYKGFSIDSVGSSLRLRFQFHTEPDLHFTPQVVLESIPASWQSIPNQVLENLVFHLGLVEAISYWKATCSPHIVVEAGGLKPPQVRWWRDLFLNGLQEFFYVNQINSSEKDFLQFEVSSSRAVSAYTGPLSTQSLVPIGGGRDSALVAAVLRDSSFPATPMLLNPTPSAYRVASILGAAPIIVRRAIHPCLLELNARGFLNGHTPFSAYLAFLNALCLILYDHSNIVLANERSSNEPSLRCYGRPVNHQYSKSFDFERRFDIYLGRFLAVSARYFSLIRPLYELQIGKHFTRLPELFSKFRSCNRNAQPDSWCGNCPKCLSVFLTLYPFLSDSAVIEIFGTDYFERAESIPILSQLAGLGTHKPFDCVCTRKESIAALYLSIRKVERSGRPLPLALEYAAREVIWRYPAAVKSAEALLQSFGPHRIPPVFESALSFEIAKGIDRPRSLGGTDAFALERPTTIGPSVG